MHRTPPSTKPRARGTVSLLAFISLRGRLSLVDPCTEAGTPGHEWRYPRECRQHPAVSLPNHCREGTSLHGGATFGAAPALEADPGPDLAFADDN